jgi:hypothetical protein
VAKACAKTPHLLARPLAKGEALLHGGRQGAGEFGRVITQGIMPRGHHLWLDAGSLQASGDSLVHIILPNRGADDGVDLRGELLGRGHPIPQGDRHRHNPLAGGDPGNDLLDQVGGGLGHAPPGTRRTKPAPLAAEGERQLLVAGVTAQPEEPVREDATL